MGNLGTMTKQFTPAQFGESHEQPVRTLLLLRAWAYWRAHLGDWALTRDTRLRHFNDHLACLERDVKALGNSCKLLGDRKANTLFIQLVPDLVKRLKAA